MSLNWREIDRILEELSLVGSFVREIHQPSHDSLVFSFYRREDRFKLYVSLSAKQCRLHRLTVPISNPQKLPRFAALLRSVAKNGRVERAEQIGAERVVRISVTKGGRAVDLWFRLWGGASNCLVTEPDGRIIDAFYRRPKRNEVAGGIFDVSSLLTEQSNRGRREYAVRELPGDGSFNARIEKEYLRLEEAEFRVQLKGRLMRMFQERENKIEVTLDRLMQRRSSHADHERLREQGDLITANIHLLRKGDSWLVADDFSGERKLNIELRPDKTPAENARVYYERSRKARVGIRKTESEIRVHTENLSAIQTEISKISECDDLDQLLNVASRHGVTTRVPPLGAGSGAIRATPARDGRDRARSEQFPGLVRMSGSHRILVGRNDRENDLLLREHVKGNDFWFHVRDFPGAYVFVSTNRGKSVPLDVMLDAGNCAVFFSKAKSAGHADVYYTQVKYLRRAQSGKKGLVIPTREKNLHIKLDRERLVALGEQSL